MSDGRSATLASRTQTGEVVRAAGGIVVRRSPEGWLQVAVVHRPERCDWSFPKGKLEPDESFEECARREVMEETGLVCRLGRFVGHTEYRDRKDRPKVVAYWVMHVEGGTFLPNEEVDELRWVDLATAQRLLSYDRDKDLVIVVAAAEDVACPL